jgi:hypothetical protein
MSRQVVETECAGLRPGLLLRHLRRHGVFVRVARVSRSLGPVGYPFGAGLARAVGAAEEASVRLHAVAYDLDAAVLAGRGEGVDGALEAVEGVRVASGHTDLEGLVVLVAANLASGHLDHPLPDWLYAPFLTVTTPTIVRTNVEQVTSQASYGGNREYTDGAADTGDSCYKFPYEP